MEFFLFLFFWVFFVLAIVCFLYYYRILYLRPKTVYSDDEIKNILQNLQKQFSFSFPNSEPIVLAYAWFIPFFFAVVWCSIGGLLSEDFTASDSPNYFFQFPFPFLIFAFSFSFLRQSFSFGTVGKVFEQGNALLVSLASAFLAWTLTTWASSHDIYFLFFLLNLIIYGFFLGKWCNGENFLGVQIFHPPLVDEDMDYDSSDRDFGYDSESQDTYDSLDQEDVANTEESAGDFDWSEDSNNPLDSDIGSDFEDYSTTSSSSMTDSLDLDLDSDPVPEPDLDFDFDDFGK